LGTLSILRMKQTEDKEKKAQKRRFQSSERPKRVEPSTESVYILGQVKVEILYNPGHGGPAVELRVKFILHFLLARGSAEGKEMPIKEAMLSVVKVQFGEKDEKGLNEPGS